MRIHLVSLGCRLNYAEMTALSRQLAQAGHDLAADPDLADICVLNSCAVTAEAARKSRQLARQLACANPRLRLIVTGCYATLEREGAAALPNVVAVVGNERKEDLAALVETMGAGAGPEVADRPRATLATAAAALPRAAGHRTRAFVKVQDGCRNRCTFCVVTVARGEERSRPVADVVAEVNALHQDGYREVVLTGVHLGAYGRDAGADLRELVLALLRDTAIPRVRLSSVEPFDLTPGFFEMWAPSLSEGRLMPHLHLPAQSGSDRVLRRMARRYTAAEYERLAGQARAGIPGLTITTDLIAGFPGESEADFEETVRFARRVGFAHLHVFAYSPRPGTAAARLDGQVPAAERRRRCSLLNELDQELGAAVRRSFLGEVREVLWEAQVSRNGGHATWSGLTDNYLRVLATTPAGESLHNRITATRLLRLDAGGLWGEILDGRDCDDTGRTPG